MTAGLVKKVDKGAGKVTILKEGDKILFVAEKVDGAFTVMRFEPR